MRNISPIPPGDYDPACEADHECQDCSDILIADMFGELFCPTCVRKELEKETNE